MVRRGGDLGVNGYVDGRRERFSLQRVSVTPNQHALARQFAFSDNYYQPEPVNLEALVAHLQKATNH